MLRLQASGDSRLTAFFQAASSSSLNPGGASWRVFRPVGLIDPAEAKAGEPEVGSCVVGRSVGPGALRQPGRPSHDSEGSAPGITR